MKGKKERKKVLRDFWTNQGSFRWGTWRIFKEDGISFDEILYWRCPWNITNSIEAIVAIAETKSKWKMRIIWGSELGDIAGGLMQLDKVWYDSERERRARDDHVGDMKHQDGLLDKHSLKSTEYQGGVRCPGPWFQGSKWECFGNIIRELSALKCVLRESKIQRKLIQGLSII